MFGVPGQSPADLRADIEAVLAIGPSTSAGMSSRQSPERALPCTTAPSSNASPRRSRITTRRSSRRCAARATAGMRPPTSAGRDTRAATTWATGSGTTTWASAWARSRRSACERRRNRPGLRAYLAAAPPAPSRRTSSSSSRPSERGMERLMLGLRLDRPLHLNGLAALVDDAACARLAAAGLVRRDGRHDGAHRPRPVPRQRRGCERAAMSGRPPADAAPGYDSDPGRRRLYRERPPDRLQGAGRGRRGRCLAVHRPL